MFTKDRQKRLIKFVFEPSTLIRNITFRNSHTISDRNHIFVVGAPRSGTTLVKQILSTHPRLRGPGYETAIFMFKDIFNFKFSGFKREEISALIQKSNDIVDFFDQFAEANLEKLGGERFVEKTPPHVLQLKFLIKHFPKAQFINIFRDGRDCYCSAQKHPNIVQGRSVENYATYWKKCIKSRLTKASNPQIFDIKYEELVANPGQIVPEIMNFLGEEFDPKQINPEYYSKNVAVNTHKSHFNKLSKPINGSSQGRWKSEMQANEIHRFHQIAGDELRLLRYSTDY